MTLVNHLTSDISLLTLQQLFHVVSISHTSYNPSRPSRCMPVYRCMPQQLRLIARLEFLGGALRSSLWMVYLGGQVWHRLCRKASEPAPCSILFHLVPSCSSLFQLVPACSKSLFGSFWILAYVSGPLLHHTAVLKSTAIEVQMLICSGNDRRIGHRKQSHRPTCQGHLLGAGGPGAQECKDCKDCKLAKTC